MTWLELRDGPVSGEFHVDNDRLPLFMRAVVNSETAQKDVLDRANDEPKDTEHVFAYRRVRAEYRCYRGAEKSKAGGWVIYEHMPKLFVRVYSDGSCNPTNPGPAAAAAVVVDEKGDVIVEQAKPIGVATNNVAEYKGLLLGISLARLVGATHAEFLADSELVVRQVSGFYAIRDPELSALHGRVTGALDYFLAWRLHHIPRKQNARSDWLANQITRPDSKAAKIPQPAAV